MRTDSFPPLMVHLSTIGPLSFDLGTTRLNAGSPQACAALLYLTVERGKEVPRRTLVELLFPESSETAGAHALRQQLYRLRKLGLRLDGDATTVLMPRDAATWDIEALESRGHCTDEELDRLSKGYLSDYAPEVSPAFDEWLDDHRSSVSTMLRRVLLGQLREEKAKHRFAAVDRAARACLALDPLNEEATLAAAEVLVMSGSKVEALMVLDRYIDEVGGRSRELRFAPKLLRERISEYVVDPGLLAEPPLIGRDGEIATLRALLSRVKLGGAEACVVWGSSGIGKTRLLNEASAIAALDGLVLIRCALHPHDQRRPLAVLRDMAPRLLDLPGSLGCSPDSLALMRGICGRGEMPHRDLPKTTHDSEAALAAVIAAATDLLDAVCAERSVLICVEDAHWLDPASLELIVDAVAGQRSLCILMASQRAVQLPQSLADAARVNSIEVPRLPKAAATTLMHRLFERSGRAIDSEFADWAIGLADGVPFYLQTLFVEYVATGDRTAIPSTLTASLASRLERLGEPSRSLFDAIVVLGAECTLARLDALIQLPRHSLVASLRELEARGLIRTAPHSVAASHELFAITARNKMPASVSRTLHRSTAEMLGRELASSGQAKPWEIAAHWLASGDAVTGLSVMRACAADAVRLGRPQEAVDILARSVRWELSAQDSVDVLTELISACDAAGEWQKAVESLDELLTRTPERNPSELGADLRVCRAEYSYFSGRQIASGAHDLIGIASRKSEPTVLRLRAAKLLVCAAEDSSNEDLATRALSAIVDIDCATPHQKYPLLIYHAVFGDLGQAAALAGSLADEAQSFSSPMRRHGAYRAAGSAVFRSGDTELAESFFLCAHEAAVAAGSRTARIAAGSSLAYLYWCAGRREAMESWHDRVGHEVARSAFPNMATQYYSNRILFDLEAGRVSEAEGALMDVYRFNPVLSEGRWQAEKLGFDVRLALSKLYQPDAKAVDTLAEYHLVGRLYGLQDQIADTLIWAMRSLGRNGEAETLRREYVDRFRRERYPIPSGFVRLLG